MAKLGRKLIENEARDLWRFQAILNAILPHLRGALMVERATESAETYHADEKLVSSLEILSLFSPKQLLNQEKREEIKAATEFLISIPKLEVVKDGVFAGTIQHDCSDIRAVYDAVAFPKVSAEWWNPTYPVSKDLQLIKRYINSVESARPVSQVVRQHLQMVQENMMQSGRNHTSITQAL